MNRPHLSPTVATLLKTVVVGLGNTGLMSTNDVALILALLDIQDA